jgi:carbon starvation protein
MLLEGMVACVSIACVMILATDSEVFKRAPNFIYARGIGSFMQIFGVPAVIGISFGLMAFTTFVYDTLDVCTRLGRYVIEELTGWKDIRGKVIGSILTAGVPIYFLFQTMEVNGVVSSAWSIFWNTFGASNQLLAALALIGVSIWLRHAYKSHVWLAAFLPAVWMYFMSMWALCIAIYNGWVLKVATQHPSVPFVSVVLIVLALMVGVETVMHMLPGKYKVADANA